MRRRNYFAAAAVAVVSLIVGVGASLAASQSSQNPKTHLKPRFELALLTNNGALLREALPALAPEVCALIDQRLHASCDFGAVRE